MVEARERAPSDEEEKDESFVDKPAILDKFKAAGLITDGNICCSDPISCSETRYEPLRPGCRHLQDMRSRR